ncbi:MAG: 4Fe-4S dicluster domain-containing protein [Promethearchaeota archaeon]|jgi:formate hydrogenlyase subunit 6/NADH:ubiquinone oxidoreductase subunit I
MEEQKIIETENLRKFIKKLEIDTYGIADMNLLKEMETGLPIDVKKFLNIFPYAIVFGAQYGKLGKKASGTESSLFLEDAAFSIMDYLESKGYRQLIIHTEDEFDPINRLGFISLKILAKTAGLGWQGRSLLIVSPEYGPLHRLIAILTDLPLQTNQLITNECGDCRKCIEACPQNALTYVAFNDHPSSRGDVLDIKTCLGDNGCMVCILSCPWLKKF